MTGRRFGIDQVAASDEAASMLDVTKARIKRMIRQGGAPKEIEERVEFLIAHHMTTAIGVTTPTAGVLTAQLRAYAEGYYAAWSLKTDAPAVAVSGEG